MNSKGGGKFAAIISQMQNVNQNINQKYKSQNIMNLNFLVYIYKNLLNYIKYIYKHFKLIEFPFQVF